MKPQLNKDKQDYIVVKTVEEAENLVLSGSPPQSLRGKWVIVAPNGLKFVSKEDIARLPQVKSLISKAVEKEKKRILNLDCMKEESLLPFIGDKKWTIYSEKMGRNQLRENIRKELIYKTHSADWSKESKALNKFNHSK